MNTWGYRVSHCFVRKEHAGSNVMRPTASNRRDCAESAAAFRLGILTQLCAASDHAQLPAHDNFPDLAASRVLRTLPRRWKRLAT